MRRDLLYLLIFLITLLIAYWRANLKDFYERGVYIFGSIYGLPYYDGSKTVFKIYVKGGDLDELKNRYALVIYRKNLNFKGRYVEIFGNMKVKDNRILIFAKEVSFYRERSLRAFLIERVEKSIKDEGVRGLVLSFFFGESKEELPYRYQGAFFKTGLVHLLVVSGLHVATLTLILMSLLPKRYGYLLSLIGVSLYSYLLVLKNPPVIRATIMAILYLLSKLTYRRLEPLRLLLLSSSLSLLLFPHFALGLSFYLSFFAVGYIILGYQGGSLITSLFVFSGVSPIIGSISAVAPSSVLLTPLLTFTIVPFSLFTFLSSLLAFSLKPLNLLVELLGKLLLFQVHTFSKISPFLLPKLSLVEGFTLSIVGLLLLYFLKDKKKLLVPLLLNSYLLLKLW